MSQSGKRTKTTSQRAVKNREIVQEINRNYQHSAHLESGKSYIFRNGDSFVNPWRPRECHAAKSLLLPDAEKRYDEKQAIIREFEREYKRIMGLEEAHTA